MKAFQKNSDKKKTLKNIRKSKSRPRTVIKMLCRYILTAPLVRKGKM